MKNMNAVPNGRSICRTTTPLLLLLILTLSTAWSQPSRIELVAHSSSTLSQSKQFNILLPEGYDTDGDRYPVVYLFRGAVNEWVDPTQDAARRGNIKTVYDSLYNKGRFGRMILVMPGLNAPATQLEYQYLVNDLLPYIDAHYRTIPDRMHRAVDGFSLGGTIVANLLSTVPRLFISYGSYDGTLSSPYYENSLMANASPALLYDVRSSQLLFHTASLGGNNNSSNMALFNILNAKGIFNTLPSFLLDPSAQHNWFYADWHVGITLPLHWKRMSAAANALSLILKSSLNGSTVSGTVPLSWSRTMVPNSITTRLFYSSDNGTIWKELFTTTGTDSTTQWNTVPLKDGTRYRLKGTVSGDSLFGSFITAPFTVNNPGNGAPDAAWLSLAAGDTLSGNAELQWLAADADGDAVTAQVEISYNGGTTWSLLRPAGANTGHASIPTAQLANGAIVRFRLTVSDGTLSAFTISPPVIIYNKRIQLGNALFMHTAGSSDATLSLVGVAADSLRQGNYTISFQSNSGKTTYSVVGSPGGTLVQNADALDGRTEGPLFNGMRLIIQDIPAPMVNDDSSRWTIGSSPLDAEVKLVDITDGAGVVPALPTAADYELRIAANIVDTSSALYGAVAQPVPFSVWNRTLQRKTTFLFVELDGNGRISRNDELYLLGEDPQGKPFLTWHLQFTGNEGAAEPLPGDRFLVKIMKPLTPADQYQLIYNPPLSVPRSNGVPDSYSLGQNYPNPFNPSTAITYQLAAAGKVTLKVYDLLGRNVATVVDGAQEPGTYTIQFDASGLASGVYYYRIEAGNFSAVRTMLLLK